MFSNTRVNGITQQQAEDIQRDFLAGNWQLIKEDKAKYMAMGNSHIIKVFKSSGLSEKLKTWLIGGRHQRFAKGSALLDSLKINNPRVVCWGYYKGQAYLMMEIVKGENFGDFLHSFFHRPDKTTLLWKRNLLKSIAKMLAKMHAENVVHGDLRANNILLCNNNGLLQLCLIDNERTRKTWRKHREKQRNLVQVLMLSRKGFTRTDHLRFLHCYLSELAMPETKRRDYIREVLSKLEKRLTEKNRVITGRELTAPSAEKLLGCSFEN